MGRINDELHTHNRHGVNANSINPNQLKLDCSTINMVSVAFVADPDDGSRHHEG